jgi:casein kinase II subunit beta
MDCDGSWSGKDGISMFVYVILLIIMSYKVDKYKRGDFGRCPRVLCESQPLLPVGLTDLPYEKTVKLYCGRCEDIYSPKSSRHGSIDGAYFGTTFPHLLFLVYSSLIPPKSGPIKLVKHEADGSNTRKATRRVREELDVEAPEIVSTATTALQAKRYQPKIYGFQLNEIAKLQRWQEAIRDRYARNNRLSSLAENMACIGKLCGSKRWRNGWQFSNLPLSTCQFFTLS